MNERRSGLRVEHVTTIDHPTHNQASFFFTLPSQYIILYVEEIQSEFINE